MAIAGNITLVTVTGQYVDYEGEPIAGQIIFTLPVTLRNQLADQIVVPSAYAVSLDVFGQFTIVLPSTDDPDFHTSFVYTVTESFVGGRTFQAVLPMNTPSVKISSLVPAYSGESFTELVAFQAYVVEEQAVTAQEALISYSPAGVVMPVDYGGMALSYLTYSAVLAAESSYTDLLSGPFVAGVTAITPYQTQALSLASQADGWADLAIANAEELFPHPFVFTGSLGFSGSCIAVHLPGLGDCRVPIAYKVLGQSAPSATTNTTIYTCPAATQTVVSSVVVCNRSATPGTFRVAVRPNGDALANQHYVAFDSPILGNETVSFSIGLTVDASDLVVVFASSADMTFSLFGSEIT